MLKEQNTLEQLNGMKKKSPNVLKIVQGKFFAMVIFLSMENILLIWAV